MEAESTREKPKLWQEIKANTDFTEEQKTNFLSAANSLNSKLEYKVPPQENYHSMYNVVKNVENWLTSKNESGFTLDFQNI